MHREASSSEAAQRRCMGLPCSSQRSSSPPNPKVVYRGIRTASKGQGDAKMPTPTTAVTAIQSNDSLKGVLRKAKEQNSNLLVLEFTASWSEPCKFMRPAVEQMASGDFKGKADFYTLDVEQFKTFARNTRVEALPTFLLVRKTILERVVGVSKDELQRSIEKHISPFIPVEDDH